MQVSTDQISSSVVALAFGKQGLSTYTSKAIISIHSF